MVLVLFGLLLRNLELLRLGEGGSYFGMRAFLCLDGGFSSLTIK
jgi:hypothetical protein